MKHRRIGFTLIEISLFLAVTGLLFIGIALGTSNSIWQQRYNDTVQNFADFLKNVYSQVSNPQSIGDGRGGQAIYGKLITFGEQYGLDGKEANRGDEWQKIFVYDVIGDAVGTGTGEVREMLKSLDVNAVKINTHAGAGTVSSIVPAGMAESYSPRWKSSVEEMDKNNQIAFRGSVLIVRHPKTGIVNTLFYANPIEVNKAIKEATEAGYSAGTMSTVKNLLKTKLQGATSVEMGFMEADVNFCLNPYGLGSNLNTRRNVRIAKGARNSSGVAIMNLDGDDNGCR